MLLSVSLHKKIFMHGIDVKNEFLSAPLEHELYMDKPEGFVPADNPEHVCKLHKYAHGLKQSPRAWYHTIRPVLEEVGVLCTPIDNRILGGTVDGHKAMQEIYCTLKIC